MRDGTRNWPVYPLLAGAAAWYASNLRGGLFVDEAIYARTAAALFRGDLYLNPTHLIAPTAKYLMGVGLVLAGDPIGARATTAVFALLVVYLVYRLGDLLHGRAVGLVAAVAIAGTHFFGVYAVRAMLDIPLTCFFVATVYAALRWHHDGGRRTLTAVGVLAALTVTTKAYGLIYAAPPVAFVVGSLLRDRGRVETMRELRYPSVGALVVFVVVFAPYAFVPHPPVDRPLSGPVATVLSIPVVGNFAFIVGAFLLRNVLHASKGHVVEVGATVYQYPPVWTYLYWLFERGGAVYLGALVVTLVGSGYGVLTDRDRAAGLLFASVALPFTVLSLLTVKFPRYVLPLFPLLAIGGAYYGARVLSRCVPTSLDIRQTTGPVSAFALVLVVLVAATTPPSPFVASARDPIRTDTRYDEVAAFIDQRADESGDLVVLTYSGSARISLEYYLDNRSDVRVRHFQLNNGFNETRAAAYRQNLTAGKIELVVWTDHPSRVSTSFDEFVRERGTLELSLQQSPGGDSVLLYSFSSDTKSDTTGDESRKL